MQSSVLEQWAHVAVIMEALIALVGIAAVFWEVRRSRKVSNVQASLGFYDIWISREMSDDTLLENGAEFDSYDDWKARYLDRDKAVVRAVTNMLNFFEMLGVACKSEGLDTRVAYEFFGVMAISIWEKYEQWIIDRRVEEEYPTYMENFHWFVTKSRQALADP